MSRLPRSQLARVASALGVTSSTQFWSPIALRAYRKKLAADTSFRDWYENEATRWVDWHWAHEEVTDEVSRLHLGSQIYEITELLRTRIGYGTRESVLDAGASDGFFLRRLGATQGVGANFLLACARRIAGDGFAASLADIERLPFRDGAFDRVICCETLEHVPNPVATLDELARVCSGTIHVTIPWLPRTRINSRPAGWPDVESHIFEFSPADFGKIVTHARVHVAYAYSVQVFPEPQNPVTRAWLRSFMYPFHFPKLQYYELQPTR